ncbi:hypothetical protein ACOTTU_05410 [Roseobacter sp. EG26]|uniref:hypothetical protein n=1 Tax=Roseobacter sp. EG26 TaxID=3412477 RepID=UPI003CE461FA
MITRPKIAYVLDPRFPGGTSSAVAAELECVSQTARVEVHAISTAMFPGQPVAPQLASVLRRLNIPLIWDAGEISGDAVILHNPSCLKFQETLDTTIIAKRLVVVAHENFLRPGGAEAFDVARCLDLIARCSVTLERSIAPISPWNRKTVEQWLLANPSYDVWSVLDWDWFNICAFDRHPPTAFPTDRRGRHSRAGFEKFPQRDVMDLCFPQTAKQNTILGADNFLGEPNTPTHWTLYPFGGVSLAHFFEQIDFFVYFTAATWRESFGRVLAEAVAAGKIAISDVDTAASFDGAVIGASPADVTAIVKGYLIDPDRYQDDVLAGQKKLEQFSSQAFRRSFDAFLMPQTEVST